MPNDYEKKVLQAIKDSFTAIGLKKRSGDIYTRDISADVLFWIGLNGAHRGSTFEINPVIGVRHHKIEEMVQELGESGKASSYHPPTVKTHIGYVMPAGRYTPVLLDRDAPYENAVRELTDNVARHGFAYADQYASIVALVREMDNPKHTEIPQEYRYRLPVAYFLMGSAADAQRVLQRALSFYEGKTFPAAEEYRVFAAALQRKIDEAKGRIY